MNSISKILVLLTILLLSGCISLDGKMVNAEGKRVDCSTSGGGLGLGMIVGAAFAALDNEMCESTAEEKGFLLVDDVGFSGITFDENKTDSVIVSLVSQPAAPCVRIGDRIEEVNHNYIDSVSEAKAAIFQKEGEDIELGLLRDSEKHSCNFTLTEAE